MLGAAARRSNHCNQLQYAAISGRNGLLNLNGQWKHTSIRVKHAEMIGAGRSLAGPDRPSKVKAQLQSMAINGNCSFWWLDPAGRQGNHGQSITEMDQRQQHNHETKNKRSFQQQILNQAEIVCLPRPLNNADK